MSETLWLKTLQGALEETQEIPLWGTVPSFPWKAFSDEITSLFSSVKWEVTHHKSEWLPGDQLTDGMGDDPLTQPFTLSPLPGDFYWMMPKASQKQLLENILTTEGTPASLSDESLQEGFTQFLFLNILETFNRTNPFGPLTGSFTDPTPLPEEGALAIDIKIQCNNQPLWGRILTPKETLAGFRTHFSMDNPPFVIDETLEALSLTLLVGAGSTTLGSKDWERVRVGDFLLLDRCSYDLANQRGTAMLTLGDTPLFDLRIKDGEVKILEYAVTQEENPMIEDHPPEEEKTPEELPPEQPLGEEAIPEEPAPQEPMMDDAPPPEEAAPPPPPAEEPLAIPKDIPITLTVEVGRLQMPLGKLTQLKPGNMLDLPVNPGLGVHLTVGGKRIAKGELIKLGDGIGVKVLKLGEG